MKEQRRNEVRKYQATGRFLNRLIEETHLRGKASGKLLEERMGRFWLGKELPEDKTPAWETTKRERFFAEIFGEYNEIYTSVYRLELAASFLQTLRPHRSTADVIAYHIEKTLEETYIVKERTVGFLKRLERRLKRHGQSDSAQAVVPVRERVEQAFEGIVSTRGVHVHQGRFQDEDVKRVASLDLLVKPPGGMEELEPIRRVHARVVLMKWRKLSTSNLEAIKTLLDQLFAAVEPMVFDTLAPKDEPVAANEKRAVVYKTGSMEEEIVADSSHGGPASAT